MNTNFMQIMAFLGAIGIPPIFTMTCYCIKACRNFRRQLEIMERGIKAQMRSQLIKDYGQYMKEGHLSDVELKEWQNQYSAYTELQGPNGVLEDRYKKLLTLPNY